MFRISLHLQHPVAETRRKASTCTESGPHDRAIDAPQLLLPATRPAAYCSQEPGHGLTAPGTEAQRGPHHFLGRGLHRRAVPRAGMTVVMLGRELAR